MTIRPHTITYGYKHGLKPKATESKTGLKGKPQASPNPLSKEGSTVDDQHTKVPREGGLLSLNDLAEYLSCSRTYAASLISTGTIPSFKLGSLRRIRKSDVDAYIEARLAAKG